MPNYQLRSDLPPLPERVKALPVDERGYPIPWFVAWVAGKPELRAADPRKKEAAIRQSLCWVCGQKLGKTMVFVIGPMCSINKVSAEPPSHPECAEFSARACPFLTKPHMRRPDRPMPNGCPMPGFHTTPGMAIERNPGVVALWHTTDYKTFNSNGVLFSIGEPVKVDWLTEGRPATREEVQAAVAAGLPSLHKPARQEGPHVERQLARMAKEAQRYWPAPAPTMIGG